MNKEQVIKWLNERWQLALDRDKEMGNKDEKNFLPNNPDYIYYKGVCDGIYNSGYEWIRYKDGTHNVWKR